MTQAQAKPQAPSRPGATATARPTDPRAGHGAGEEMTGAQSLIRALECAGVTDIFGIPGGAILPAYDPMLDSKQLRHILTRHEQGATPTRRAAPARAS